MVLRFSNEIFERLWNRDHIDHVQITVAETVGVEHRGRFYDQTGALRDMVPNHLFQLSALTAWSRRPASPPTRCGPRRPRCWTRSAASPPRTSAARSVRGQYVAGTVRGEDIEAYRVEEVGADSTTETYVAMRLLIDNWRWTGVPFYLRTGKALAEAPQRGRDPFQRRAVAFFRDTPIERAGRESPPPQHPARGGRHARASAPRCPGRRSPRPGRDDFRLRRLLRDQAQHRLRDT